MWVNPRPQNSHLIKYQIPNPAAPINAIKTRLKPTIISLNRR